MLVRCPQCKTEFRLVGEPPAEKVVRYLCPGCQAIVRIDVELDEVRSSSSSGSYRSIPRRKKVLVADDSELVLETCEGLLTSAGYQVLLAGDGVEALRVIRDEHPDVVVLDLLMPRMTGFDVLREVRQDERIKDTAVLAISSVYKENVLEFLQQLGAQGFLDKAKIAESLAFRVQALLAPVPGA
ncbi:MAG TPA: response regulator [Candidatus Sulfotelmatobacter sp.]|jgi:CheY-like chemotaxis protein|nr:response regulator [Candidatus Sulfotelmatobacter sp.]